MTARTPWVRQRALGRYAKRKEAGPKVKLYNDFKYLYLCMALHEFAGNRIRATVNRLVARSNPARGAKTLPAASRRVFPLVL